jgi:hypothetical protein
LVSLFLQGKYSIFKEIYEKIEENCIAQIWSDGYKYGIIENLENFRLSEIFFLNEFPKMFAGNHVGFSSMSSVVSKIQNKKKFFGEIVCSDFKENTIEKPLFI